MNTLVLTRFDAQADNLKRAMRLAGRVDTIVRSMQEPLIDHCFDKVIMTFHPETERENTWFNHVVATAVRPGGKVEFNLDL